MYSFDVLLLVHQRVLERSGSGECGRQDDTGTGLRGRRDAADAGHLPAVQPEGDPTDWTGGVVGALRAARLWKRRQWHVDVLCGDSDARRVLRLLLYDRATVHRPGVPRTLAWHGAGLDCLP